MQRTVRFNPESNKFELVFDYDKYVISQVKKAGATFNPTTKTWFISFGEFRNLWNLVDRLNFTYESKVEEMLKKQVFA